MAKAIREGMEILYRCPCMAEKCGAAASSSDVNQQKHGGSGYVPICTKCWAVAGGVGPDPAPSFN